MIIDPAPTGISYDQAVACVRDHADAEIILAIMADEFTIDTRGYSEVPAVTIRHQGRRIGETMRIQLVGEKRTIWGWTVFVEGVVWRESNGRALFGPPDLPSQQEALGAVVRGIAKRRRWAAKRKLVLPAPAGMITGSSAAQ